MRSATGKQFELTRTSAHGLSRAILTEVGAGLRFLSVGDVQLVETFSDAETPPLGAGSILVPWPNRVEDGVWRLNGVRQQLDLTEPDKHNAIHGLLRHTAYAIREQADDAITLTATVFPQHGYPFQLDTAVSYLLEADGLTVIHEISNVSAEAAPVAIGAHPYFRIGDVPTRDLTLTLAATTHIEVDARLNPIHEVPVEGTEYDFRGGLLVDDLRLDDGFGGVVFDDDGVARHTLRSPDGRMLTLWQDASFGYVQAFTTRQFPGRELAIALEPMTAPANAFNSGDGVRWLEPGQSWRATWGVRYRGSTL
ncbi:MAG: aldose 1-epimerase family protein [Terrimesophilobacter sp.]